MDSLIFTAPFLKILESACLKMTDFTASVSVDMDDNAATLALYQLSDYLNRYYGFAFCGKKVLIGK